MPPKQAQSYLPLINPVSTDFSAELAKNSRPFRDLLPRYTFEVIGAVLFAKRMGAINDSSSEHEKFIELALKFFTEANSFTYALPIWKYINTPKYNRFYDDAEYCYLHAAKQVVETLENLKKDPERYSQAYIAKLLHAQDLSMEAIAESVGGLFVAGVDTTSNTLTWMLLHLAMFPEVQEKLYRELSTVLQGADYDQSKTSQLPYMKACFKESLRMDPVSNTIQRILHDDVPLKSGHILPTGIQAYLCPAVIFRDPDYVDRPDEFIPERWFDEEKEKRAKDKTNLLDQAMSFIPFGFGPRMCLGSRVASAEMNSLVARIVQDLKIEVIGEAPKDKVTIPFLVPSPYPELKFTPRK